MILLPFQLPTSPVSIAGLEARVRSWASRREGRISAGPSYCFQASPIECHRRLGRQTPYRVVYHHREVVKTVPAGSSFKKFDKAQREGYFVGFRQATSNRQRSPWRWRG